MELLHTGPEALPPLILAHGAGSPMDDPFLERLSALLAAREVHVVRFEFPYMAARRTGARRGPDREPVARATWREVIEALGGGPNVAIGGKSFGGRMASLVADEVSARALVCLGYPFHPAGKPTQLRTEHLLTLRTPTLVLQGERDALGSRTEVESYPLSASIRLQWLPDGDHSLRPRKASGFTQEQHLEHAADAIAAFLDSLALSS